MTRPERERDAVEDVPEPTDHAEATVIRAEPERDERRYTPS